MADRKAKHLYQCSYDTYINYKISPNVVAQGNLRTCCDCFEVFNEFRRSRGPEKCIQLQSDTIPIDSIPSASLSSEMGGESPQTLHGMFSVVSEC